MLKTRKMNDRERYKMWQETKQAHKDGDMPVQLYLDEKRRNKQYWEESYAGGDKAPPRVYERHYPKSFFIKKKGENGEEDDSEG